MLPQQLTAELTHCPDVASLASAVEMHAHAMNGVHVAAATVHLAHLLTHAHGDSGAVGHATLSNRAQRGGPGSAAARAQPGASTSASISSTREQQRRGSRPHTANGRAGSASSTGEAMPHQAQQRIDDACRLSAQLGHMYVACCAQGRYSNARQHANVAWALSVSGLPPQPLVVKAAVDGLLAKGGAAMKNARPQELANVAYALARLGAGGREFWRALSTAAAPHAAATAVLATEAAPHAQSVAGHAQAQASPAPSQAHAKGHAPAAVFRPQEAAHLAWALASSGSAHNEPSARALLRSLGCACARGVGEYAPGELAMLLWAVAKANVECRPLFGAGAERLLGMLQSSKNSGSGSGGSSTTSISSDGGSSVGDGGGRGGQKKRGGGGQQQRRQQGQPQPQQQQHLCSQDVANVVWAYARSLQRPMHLLAALATALSSAAASQPQQGAASGSSAPTPGSSASTPGSSTPRAVVPHISAFSTQELSNVLWGYARLRLGYDGLVTDLANELAARFSRDSGGAAGVAGAGAGGGVCPQALSNTAWAASRLAEARSYTPPSRDRATASAPTSASSASAAPPLVLAAGPARPALLRLERALVSACARSAKAFSPQVTLNPKIL
ncbi:hypothetical protein FOA52_011706 [Chlamydomonas sp. UWO 241]|nr:hypothetical protein FOA52_011706 [Chlamydomonas sp. UWO 241]